jgi:hypothetical protein
MTQWERLTVALVGALIVIGIAWVVYGITVLIR